MNDNYLQGLFTDMSNAEYHNQIHIGSSGFKLLRRSPLHFWHASPLNPDREKKEPSRVMVMGTAWHTGIWEPHLFDAEYAAKPDIHAASTVAKLLNEALTNAADFAAKYVAIPDGISKATKEGKALHAELEAKCQIGVEESKHEEVMRYASALAGKTLLASSDLDDVRKMARAAHIHPTTQAIFAQDGGLGEASIFWLDAETGAPCRIRPDWHIPPGVSSLFPSGLIIDGKSTDDASDAAFSRTAWNSEMFFQAAFYSDGFQAHYGTKAPPLFGWLVQERDAPYATKYYGAASDFVEYGRRMYRPMLHQFAQCLSTGVWPGYSTGVATLELPAYAAKVIQEVVAA